MFDSTPIVSVYVNQISKGLLGLVGGRGHRLIRAPPAGRVSPRAWPPANDLPKTASPADRREAWGYPLTGC